MRKRKQRVKRPYKKRKYTLAEKLAYADKLRKRMTPAERVLWREIKRRQRKGSRFEFEAQKVVCGYIPDFVCESVKLIVEVDGKVHNKQRRKDAFRTKNLNKSGYAVVRFTNEFVIHSPEVVMDRVTRECLRRT